MTPVLQLCAVVILASALAPTATSAHLNDTIFAVTVSSQVTGGKQETLCAHIHGPTEAVSLNVSLDMDSGSTVILEEDVKQDFYRCLNFQVPVVSRKTVASISVTIQGESASMSKKTKILIEPPTFIHIMQTDKPIYKPGQTVQFRIVSMDTNFIPVDRVYRVVEIQDPNSNRIAQWLDKSIVSGILDLSHPMIPEAVQGTYKIMASTDKGEQISHRFDIKEYVLPKYEVKVHLPSVISILDREAALTICGKYTYGKPVVGAVKAEFCRYALRYYWRSGTQNKDICKTYELTTDKTGCATQTVNVAEFAPYKQSYDDSFEVNAEIEEYGTGVTLKGSGRTSFSSYIRTVTFEDVSESYKPGIPFEGKVKMTGPDNKPVADESVYLVATSSQNITLTTDKKGMALFSLDTSLWEDTVNLQAKSKNTNEEEPHLSRVRSPEYRSAHHQVAAFYSKSSSFLKLMQVNKKISCDKNATVRAQFIIQGEELKSGQEVLEFFYLVMSRGGIVQHGSIPVAVKVGTVNTGELYISLQQVTNLAPFAQVVIYTVMPSGEAVADSQDFPIQLCLNNKVSLKFSSLQSLPAEKTTLSLKAHPGSMCSVRAIDQSVLLLKPEEELTVGSVYSRLPLQKMSGYTYEVEDFEPYPCMNLMLAAPRRATRSIYHGSDQKNDVYSIFKEIGIKIVTNSDVKKPIDCSSRYDVYYDDMVAYMLPGSPGVADRTGKTKTVRTYFPETWIWELVLIGESGSVNVEKTVPDTITKWAAGAFCTSSVGFGVSPNIGLTAFQPFFVSLTLPYSVIRGEVFTLKATVFNYLSKCIMVNVILAESNQYTFRNCEGCQYNVCLCGEESRTFSWIVTPTALGEVNLKVSAEALKTDALCGNEVATVPDAGQIDTVIRTLLVEAEGTPQMVGHNALLCPAEGPVEKKISLLLPEVFVAGSARASVSVLGDLMGRAMKNLDKLLAMPYGCGEQNMVLFAPNIFILNYLQSTGQLTQEIQDKATRFLESGYQRELTYKHDDGSYSAFGKSDESGNTWLTSFVMKSFGGARPYIFVDPRHISDARRWLAEHQQPDGCIRSVGKLFHNGMKGGVSDDVSLTAYITAAMLELDANVTDPVVQKCLSCLKGAATGQLDNLYTTALLSYTFTLARDEEMRSKLITYLHQKSSTQGGTRHWDRAGASEKGLDSLEVEMTAYVLLALLSGPIMPDFGLDYSSGIVRWLAQQQNPYGGFSSTQDTVVALQALAKYGAATYSAEGSTIVTVTSLGGLNKGFTVDQSNRLLYQEEKLEDVPGEYTILAQGRSCVLAQISMHYNIPPPPDFSAFNVSSSTMAKCNTSRPQLILFVHVRYQGRREETNMVIVNIKLLSGYVLDKSSLDLLKRDRSVKRVDVEEGHIHIYLDGLKKDETKIYSVTLEEDVPVRNLKPAVVKVYDYYQTSDEAVTDYTSPCAESDSANQL
ncbi:putative alpha-2-macroglobulin-like isoform 2 [Scophthalmus maximus]|uniref:Putative alpha-2-macroglobulin-like isoform 2 n=1 Tax=Scophthalmus maximus TaxID=52904 RepID=A0A2U9B3J4_SCOMX|nr:alpha-2-macroglobulin isoform X2 [Scophthalmus maximus]AWO98490.1 putative alpha-2-macroglobulin-like isoform 2 [Scophthalmus maximus]